MTEDPPYICYEIPAIDEPCERCYAEARDVYLAYGGDPALNLPIDAYLALPRATGLYARGRDQEEYLCDRCAAAVEKPDYLEDLTDD